MLRQHRIRILEDTDPHSNHLIKNGSIYIRAKGHKHYGTEVTFDFIIAKFHLEIKMLNLHRLSEKEVSSGIGFGSFGIVKQVEVQGQKMAIKKIMFDSHPPQDIFAALADRNDYSFCPDIEAAIREYAIYKICSMLQVGPQIIFSDGYDLVCFNDCIEFQMELCQPLTRRDGYSSSEQDLKMGLAKLHAFKMVHKDIKPSNIVFSPTLMKNVFADFGLAHSVSEDYWQESFTKPQGSLKYASEPMKLLLTHKGPGRFNLYINDIEGLKKSVAEISELGQSQEEQVELSQHYSEDCPSYSWDEEDSSFSEQGLSESPIPTIFSSDSVMESEPSSINYHQARAIYSLLRTDASLINFELIKTMVEEECRDQKQKVTEAILAEVSELFFPTFEEKEEFQLLEYQNKVRVHGRYSEEVLLFLRRVDSSKAKPEIDRLEKVQLKYDGEKSEEELMRSRVLQNHNALMNELLSLMRKYEVEKPPSLKKRILNLYLEVKKNWDIRKHEEAVTEKGIVRVLEASTEVTQPSPFWTKSSMNCSRRNGSSRATSSVWPRTTSTPATTTSSLS